MASNTITASASGGSVAIGGTVGGSPASGQILYVNGTVLAQGGPAIVSGVLTSPGAGSGSEAFGSGATAAGTNSVSIGATAPGNSVVVIGKGATSGTTANGGVVIGQGATNGLSAGQNVVIGQSAVTSDFGSLNVVAGALARCNGGSSLSLGYNAVTTAGFAIAVGKGAFNQTANTIVFGACTTANGSGSIADSSAFIGKMVIGRGHVDATPLASVSYAATGGVGTDIGASDIILAAGASTGLGSNVNARGGAVRLQVAPRALATGSTAGTLIDRTVLAPDKSLTNSSATATKTVALPAGTAAVISLRWGVTVGDGTDFQAAGGVTTVALVNKAGTLTKNVSTAGASANAVSSGTLAVTFDASLASNVATITATATSSLTPSTGNPRLWMNIDNLSPQAITLS